MKLIFALLLLLYVDVYAHQAFVKFFPANKCGCRENSILFRSDKLSLNTMRHVAKEHYKSPNMLKIINEFNGTRLLRGKECTWECAMAFISCMNSCYCAVPPCSCCMGCVRCLNPLYLKCCKCILPESYCSTLPLTNPTGETTASGPTGPTGPTGKQTRRNLGRRA